MKKIASVILSLVFLTIVYLLTDWEQALKSMFSANLFLFSAAFFLFTINYYLKAVRLKMLSNNECKSNLTNFLINIDYGTINYFLPVGLGEFSLPYLVKQKYKTPIPRGFKIHLSGKILDIFVLFLVGCLLLVFSPEIKALALPYFAFSLLVVISTLFLLIILLLATKSKIIRLIKNWFSAFTDIKKIIISVMIWISIIGYYALLAMSIDAHYSLDIILFISIIAILLTFIPTQGFANIGTYEAAWFLGATTFGISEQDALVNAITTHILLTIMVVTCFAMSRVVGKIREFA